MTIVNLISLVIDSHLFIYRAAQQEFNSHGLDWPPLIRCEIKGLVRRWTNRWRSTPTHTTSGVPKFSYVSAKIAKNTQDNLYACVCGVKISKS